MLYGVKSEKIGLIKIVPKETSIFFPDNGKRNFRIVQIHFSGKKNV